VGATRRVLGRSRAARNDDGNIGTEVAEGDVPALAKTAGSAVGGVAGGALGMLAGPEGMAAGAIAGSMAGEGAGEMVGEVESSAKGDDSEYTQPACNLPQQVTQREILRQNQGR
jgi:phage tail tape-measure protein